ncbi:MAG: hypothetical protein GAK45_00312 [Pseudomonas citronellolis]|nr:MAG: hypothetical protein GAK45_00312 [Pseudomonas citronellolis]
MRVGWSWASLPKKRASAQGRAYLGVEGQITGEKVTGEVHRVVLARDCCVAAFDQKRLAVVLAAGGQPSVVQLQAGIVRTESGGRGGQGDRQRDQRVLIGQVLHMSSLFSA